MVNTTWRRGAWRGIRSHLIDHGLLDFRRQPQTLGPLSAGPYVFYRPLLLKASALDPASDPLRGKEDYDTKPYDLSELFRV